MESNTSSIGTLRKPLCIAADAKVIGTVGRLVDVKGQVHLIDAMPVILAAIPNAHLVLMGSGPLQAELTKRADGLGVGANVHFAGYRADVAACLKDVDIFVLPSLNEGMGRVLVEAMVMRVPVVGSNVCGIKDLIQDRVNGRLVPVANPAAIAEAVTEILRDPNLAKQMGEAGHDFVVPDYSVETMLKQTQELYFSELALASNR
jgi:glycosyltransferase involved in cell wall biosynthesis